MLSGGEKKKVPIVEKREGSSVCWEQIVAPVTEKGDKKLGKTPSYITGLNNVAQVSESDISKNKCPKVKDSIKKPHLFTDSRK